MVVTAPLPSGTAFVSAYFTTSSGSVVTAPTNPNLPVLITPATFSTPRHNPKIITQNNGQQYVAWWFDFTGQTTKYLQLNAQVNWDNDPATDSPIKNGAQLFRRIATGYEKADDDTASVTIGGIGTGAPVLGLSNDATSNNPALFDSYANPIVTPGQTLTFTFQAFNQGPNKAENVMLYDTFVAMNAGVKPTYVPGSFTLNGKAISDKELTFQAVANSTSIGASLADIGPNYPAGGSFTTVQFEVKVPTNAKAGISITSLCHLQADNLNAVTFGDRAPLNVPWSTPSLSASRKARISLRPKKAIK